MNANADRLREARQQDGLDKRRMVKQAIRQMTEQGTTVTFESVRRQAGVSRSLLYSDPEIKREISTIRSRQGVARQSAIPLRSLVSDRSLRNDLELARSEVRDLTCEVGRLRTQLARVLDLDALADEETTSQHRLGDLEDRVVELEGENMRLRDDVRRLESENTALDDSLQASRQNYRRIMSEANRRAGVVADGVEWTSGD